MAPQPKPRCAYCYKPIHKQRNGEWYHDRNASTSCSPGSGSDRRALPAAPKASTRTAEA
jgi:hypothetical protein